MAEANIKVDVTVDEKKLKSIRKEFLNIETFYSYEEVKKLCDAYREKYKISECVGLPYHPKKTRIKLTGKIVK